MFIHRRIYTHKAHMCALNHWLVFVCVYVFTKYGPAARSRKSDGWKKPWPEAARDPKMHWLVVSCWFILAGVLREAKFVMICSAYNAWKKATVMRQCTVLSMPSWNPRRMITRETSLFSCQDSLGNDPGVVANFQTSHFKSFAPSMFKAALLLFQDISFDNHTTTVPAQSTCCSPSWYLSHILKCTVKYI